MYARAAIIGRVTREQAENRRKNAQFIAIPAPSKEEPQDELPSLNKRCFLPCATGPWLTILTSLLLLAIGAVMCNFAFHADDYSKRISPDGNGTTVVTNISMYRGLKSLTYLGPTVMGFGAFFIIVACVVLLDIREKQVKDIMKRQAELQADFSKELSYRAILNAKARKSRASDPNGPDDSSTRRASDNWSYNSGIVLPAQTLVPADSHSRDAEAVGANKKECEMEHTGESPTGSPTQNLGFDNLVRKDHFLPIAKIGALYGESGASPFGSSSNEKSTLQAPHGSLPPIRGPPPPPGAPSNTRAPPSNSPCDNRAYIYSEEELQETTCQTERTTPITNPGYTDDENAVERGMGSSSTTQTPLKQTSSGSEGEEMLFTEEVRFKTTKL